MLQEMQHIREVGENQGAAKETQGSHRAQNTSAGGSAGLAREDQETSWLLLNPAGGTGGCPPTAALSKTHLSFQQLPGLGVQLWGETSALQWG